MKRANGSGTIERRARGWLPRLPDARRTPLEHCPTYEEAEALLDAAVRRLRDGHVASTKSLLAYGRGVLEARELAGYRAASKEASRWERYVGESDLAQRAVATLTARDVRRWAQELRTRVAHQTAANALGTLRAVLRQAVEDDVIGASPAETIRLHHAGRTDTGSTWLTWDEIEALLWAIDDAEARTLVAVAVGTGLRRSARAWAHGGAVGLAALAHGCGD